MATEIQRDITPVARMDLHFDACWGVFGIAGPARVVLAGQPMVVIGWTGGQKSLQGFGEDFTASRALASAEPASVRFGFRAGATANRHGHQAAFGCWESWGASLFIETCHSQAGFSSRKGASENRV